MHGLLNGLLGIDVLVSYLVRAVVMLIVMPFHEAAHALVSWLLGGPHRQERRTPFSEPGAAF